MPGIMNKFGNAVHNALVIAQIKSPDFSNAEAAKQAEVDRLANAGRSTPLLPPSESWKTWGARTFGAVLGHTIHQTIGCFLPRFGAELADDFVQKTVEENPAAGMAIQLGILLLDVTRFGHMMRRADNRETENIANIAYAGMSDKNADGTIKDGSAAQNSRKAAAWVFGGGPIVMDAITLFGTFHAHMSGDKKSLETYAALTKLQVRNLLYATGRDTLQTAFNMVGGDQNEMTAHHLAPSRAIYAAQELLVAGIGMDYVSKKYANNPTMHAFSRACANTVPEITDWFYLTHIGTQIAAQHQSDAKPQHWDPSMNKNLKEFYMKGDFKALGKFMKEIGYKLTDQSLARTGVYQLSGLLGSTTDTLQALNMDVNKHFGLKSFINNAAVSGFIFLNYRSLTALWQSQGAQRAKFLQDAPPPAVHDIENPPPVRIEEIHEEVPPPAPSYIVEMPETPRNSVTRPPSRNRTPSRQSNDLDRMEEYANSSPGRISGGLNDIRTGRNLSRFAAAASSSPQSKPQVSNAFQEFKKWNQEDGSRMETGSLRFSTPRISSVSDTDKIVEKESMLETLPDRSNQ